MWKAGARLMSVVATSVLVSAFGACSSSPKRTVARLVASLPKTSADKPAGAFVVGHVPAGHMADTVVRGTSVGLETARWCAGKVCASQAFSDWRNLGWSGLQGSTRESWPKGSYVVVFDAPAPRVDDNRKNLLPTGTAFDVAMLPGSRADLAIGANYDVMGSYDGGQEGPAHDVWFERRLVHVGARDAVLTESYGSDEKFPRDIKTLYFEGPHGELGVVRAISNIFYGSDIWLRVEGDAARLQASHRETKLQQTTDAELVAVAASVRAATDAEFAAAASRVADGRICTPEFGHKSTRDERLIASGTLTLPDTQPDGSTDKRQVWKLRQGRDASGHATCPRDDTTCPKQLGPCLDWQMSWGDWQRSTTHAVYYEFRAQHGPTLFALAPDVRSLRVTTLTGTAKAPRERVATTVSTFPGLNGVRWAFSPVPAYRVTALDAAGRMLETVRSDLAGP